MSKGGLLYHFRTKEALLQAMVSRLAETLNAVRENKSAKLPLSPARGLKAHILSIEAIRRKETKPIASVLIAAGAHDPKLLKKVKESRKMMIEEMKASKISPAFMTVVICAAEGLVLSDLLGLSVYNRKERQNFIDELFRLIDEEEARLCR